VFTFRRLSRDDFALRAEWMAAPHVHEWWDHEYTPDALERDFGPAIDGDEPAEDHVVVPVNSANERSWRALLRAGFRLVARGEIEPDSPRHESMHEVLRIDRPGGAAPARGS
jgi:hypothetical protein